jgi:excisionase family DNA binding protein
MKTISLIEITPDEFISQTAEEVFKRIKEHLSKKEQSESYLTSKEAAKLLQLSLPTLGKYCKAGFIRSYRISKTIRFKKSEIDQMVNKGLRFNLKREGGLL